MTNNNLEYRAVTISGKVAVGTSTLAKHLEDILGWKRINAGDIQREYDRTHGINENKQGATARSDKHENEIDAMTKRVLKEENEIIYEAWLAGFMAQGIDGVLKVLIICSEDAVRIDRVANRDNISIPNAKEWLKQREEENTIKWKRLYGDHEFWNPKSEFYDLVIDTYSTGPNETVGKVLDKLGYTNNK